MGDLVWDEYVAELKNPIVAYVEGPPLMGETENKKVRAMFVKCVAQNPRGTIIIVPGRVEYIEKYAQIITSINQKGFDCLCLDNRGQGLSDRVGEKYHQGHMDDFSKARQSLVNVIAHFRAQMRMPYYLLCHSMGGLIVLDGMVNGEFADCNGAIFCSPMWSVTPNPLLRIMMRVLSGLGFASSTAPSLNVHWAPNKFENNRISSNRKSLARNHALMILNSRLQMGGPTNGWFVAAYKAFLNFTSEKISKITTPILLMQSEKETLIDGDGSREVAKFFPNCEAHIIKDALHELLMEREEISAEVWNYIDDFLARNS